MASVELSDEYVAAAKWAANIYREAETALTSPRHPQRGLFKSRMTRAQKILAQIALTIVEKDLITNETPAQRPGLERDDTFKEPG
jgi:hypothetical protein